MFKWTIFTNERVTNKEHSNQFISNAIHLKIFTFETNFADFLFPTSRNKIRVNGQSAVKLANIQFGISKLLGVVK